MERPEHNLRNQTGTTAAQLAPRRFGGLIIVTAVHIGIVALLILGMVAGEIEKKKEDIQATVEQQKVEAKAPPPPPPDVVKPPPPFVPPPEINIASDAPVTNAITAVQAVAPTPPTPAPAAAPSPSKAVGRTHDCQSYFPDLSRRLNESGDVLIGYDVGVDGAISNVHIAKSSGSERLDNAAVSCVSSKWRNTPAMQGDTPVASPGHQAIIRFSLH